MTRHLPLGSVLLLLAILALLAGCSLLRAPQAVVGKVVPKSGSTQPDPMELQIQIERFTDSFFLETVQALDDYANKSGNESDRLEALQLKLVSISAVTSIASGPNPNANLLDLVAVVTLGRMAVEQRWTKATNQPAFDQWLSTSRHLESNVWQLAALELKPAHIKELRETIQQWSENNPQARDSFFARPQEFATMVVHQQRKQTDRSSVFSLVDLDPLSGLDPAVREITQSRMLAERAMSTLQRMPFLLRFQTELLAYRLSDQPQMRLALSNVTLLAGSADRITRATESVSQTAAQLPDRISLERKEILLALDQQEGKLRDLSAKVDQALQSGEKMSTSLNTTLVTFTGLMKLFGVGEPSTNSTVDTNSPPFNILDYGQVADQVGTMAKDINTLVASVNQSVPQIQALSHSATVDAQKVVDRAFRLGLVLIAFLLTGAVLAGLVYRFFSEKLKQAECAAPADTL
jgi:hypothetical protein